MVALVRPAGTVCMGADAVPLREPATTNVTVPSVGSRQVSVTEAPSSRTLTPVGLLGTAALGTVGAGVGVLALPGAEALGVVAPPAARSWTARSRASTMKASATPSPAAASTAKVQVSTRPSRVDRRGD